MSDIASRQYGRIDWLTRTDLEPKMRQVCEYLDRAPRKCREAWWSAERIARDLGEGFSVATVRVILRKLTLRGMVEIVADYSLKTRRRIVLLWRKAAEPAPHPERAPQEAPQMETVRDDLRRVRREDVPAAAPAPVAEAAPAVPSRGGEPEAQKATPEEVRELMDAAARVEGSTPAKALWLLRLCTPAVAIAACRRAADRVRGWGWVVRVGPAWMEEGIPDYIGSRPDSDAALHAYTPSPITDDEYIAMNGGVSLEAI